MEAKVYNQKGEEAGTIKLPIKIFGLPWNADLVHQVITSLRSDARRNTAQVKDRSEVRGGGRKPWRQKGTGRARHGSIRSPLWRGGGVTHGPTTKRNYVKKINKKMKSRALCTVLSQKLRDQEVVFVEDLVFAQPKTKEAQVVLNQLARLPALTKLNYKKGKRALIAAPKLDGAMVKSFRNIPSAQVGEVRNLNPLTVLQYKYLILSRPQEAVEVLAGRAK